LSAKNAGQTGLNRITQAVSSTSTWYAFAGQVKLTTVSTYEWWELGVQTTGRGHATNNVRTFCCMGLSFLTAL
jgi:hypothetical protein